MLSGEPTANQEPPQPLKKDEKDNLLKKTMERVRENLKKNGKKKGDFPYESSLGGVRLMTSPL